MNQTLKTFCTWILGTLLITTALPAVAVQRVQSSMQGFKMQVCSPQGTSCLLVTAPSSRGSQFKLLHTLEKPRLEISTLSNEETDQNREVFEGSGGYIDLVENHVVIYKRENNVLTEVSFDLTTFERFTRVHGDTK
ncbi:MAG: hypothetical protein AAGB31_13815 [Bdellovibrio sp.]